MTVRSFMKDRESRGKTCLKLAQWLVWQPLVTLGVISPWIDLNYCLKMQLLTVPTKACHWRCLLNYKSQQDITADLCVCVAWRWAPSFVCSSRWQGLWFVSHSWAWGRLSVGSCGCLISPVLTQAQLIDGALWDSARKLSGPCQRRGIHSGYLKLQPQWPFSSLFAYSELHKGNDFYSIEAHRGSAWQVLWLPWIIGYS